MYRFLRGPLKDTAVCALCGAVLRSERVDGHAQRHAARGDTPIELRGSNEHVLRDVEVAS